MVSWFGYCGFERLPSAKFGATEVEHEENGKSDSEDFDDRVWFDVGIPLGIGYHIMENHVVGFKFVISMTSLSSKSGDDSSLNQIGLGMSYLF